MHGIGLSKMAFFQVCMQFIPNITPNYNLRHSILSLSYVTFPHEPITNWILSGFLDKTFMFMNTLLDDPYIWAFDCLFS